MKAIKFWIIAAVLGGPAFLAASPVLAGSKTARCFMMVADIIYMNGTCEFSSFDENGTFFIKVEERNFSVFAYVNVNGNPSAWNEARDSHAHTTLGVLKRDPAEPACHFNDLARICAWAE